jgi:hypothetical protein
MPISETLKKFRGNEYANGDDKSKGESEESQGVRSFKLSDEESKSLEPYTQRYGPGEEIVLEVTGRKEGDHFHISSVKYASGASGGMEPPADEDARKVAGLDVRPMVQPSPS